MTQPARRNPAALKASLEEFLATEGAATASAFTRSGVPQARSTSLDSAYAEVLEQEAAKGQRPVRSQPWWSLALRPVLLALLTAASAYVWLGKPAWLYPPVPGPVPASDEQTLEQTLMTTGLALNAWRQEHEALPATLKELDLGVSGVDYQPNPVGGYQLVAHLDGQRWILNEAVPGDAPEITVVPDQGKVMP